MAVVSITAPSGRTITPGSQDDEETIMVKLTRGELASALRALFDSPLHDLEGDTAYEELDGAYLDLTGEEFLA